MLGHTVLHIRSEDPNYRHDFNNLFNLFEAIHYILKIIAEVLDQMHVIRMIRSFTLSLADVRIFFTNLSNVVVFPPHIARFTLSITLAVVLEMKYSGVQTTTKFHTNDCALYKIML